MTNSSGMSSKDRVTVASEKATFIADRIAAGVAAPELEVRELAQLLRSIAPELEVRELAQLLRSIAAELGVAKKPVVARPFSRRR